MRRFLVPVFVVALTLGVAPRPSFAFDDHYRCMYHCAERGFSRPRSRPPATPRPERRTCWLFCGRDSRRDSWRGPFHHPWPRPRPHHRPDRYDGYARYRDAGRDRGDDAHRTHPRGPDF